MANEEVIMCCGFSSLSVFDKSATVLLYLTIGLVALIAVIGILTWVYNKERIKDFYKYAIGVGVGYSIGVIAIMAFLLFDDMVKSGEFSAQVFWPIFALFALLVAAIIGALIISLTNKRYMKLYLKISFLLIGAYLIGMLIYQLIKTYQAEFVLADELILIFSTLILIGILVSLTLVFGKKSTLDNHTKSIVYAAICIAMSFALSYIRFFRLPQGGSITFVSILPIMFYSYMFGIRKGVLAGFIYGLMQALQDPWILHPIQFLLDYPLAFSMIGLAGIFRDFPAFKKKVILQFVTGGVLIAILRYACHVITGIIIFDIYAADGFNAVAWGFFYNLFVFVDAAIAIFAGGIMLSSKAFRKQLQEVQIT
jgi:thiamine transporter